ncbi:MAG: hypothetical protein R3290_09260 [Acidimicrobiia bacterium]|nr:hypothetical protein [Acidimicrobiia bacterium]
MSAPDSTDRMTSRLEMVAAIILGLATVASAWGAYQATRWSGVQATAYTEAGLASTEAAKAYQLADSKLNLDQTLFVEWAVAVSQGDEELADYIDLSLFSPELGAAVDAWEESDETPTPFDTDAYVIEELDIAEEWEAESAEQNRAGRDANQTADNYVLLTVILTSALFFAGISTVLRSVRVRYALLGLGGALLVGATIVMLTFPIE